MNGVLAEPERTGFIRPVLVAVRPVLNRFATSCPGKREIFKPFLYMGTLEVALCKEYSISTFLGFSAFAYPCSGA